MCDTLKIRTDGTIPKTLLAKAEQINAEHGEQVICEMFSEVDYGRKSYWIHLSRGWVCTWMDCGTIHEDTVKECIEYMNHIERGNWI